MEYRVDKRTGKDVSLLGFGAMRLKTSGGDVDIDAATSQISLAIDRGVNYFDTAFIYGNGSGSNERALGLILENLNCRDDVFLSTKMNRLIIHSREDMDAMFNSQLENLRTSYIDYYFLHTVTSYSDVTYLIDIGLLDFIEDKKSKGQIINIGFSYHGSYDDFRKILDLYDWDVTLLQFNYLDRNIQAGIKGIRLASERNMNVIIMEPLKGGLLAGKMPVSVEKIIAEHDTVRSNVDLAFSWIFNHPEITCVLSGMNSLDMVEENTCIADNHLNNPLSSDELDLIDEVGDCLLKLNKIGCTGCNYCMPCPNQVNIPDTFKMYNDKYLFPENKSYGVHATFLNYASNILGLTGEAHDASLCVDCGLCVSKCPQHLEIPSLLRMVNSSYHGRIVKFFVPLLKKLMKIVF